VERFAATADAVEDAPVVGWERFEIGPLLPDPDGRHMLAAFVRGSAGICLRNRRSGLPAAAIAKFDNGVPDEDSVLLDLWGPGSLSGQS